MFRFSLNKRERERSIKEEAVVRKRRRKRASSDHRLVDADNHALNALGESCFSPPPSFVTVMSDHSACNGVIDCDVIREATYSFLLFNLKFASETISVSLAVKRRS